MKSMYCRCLQPFQEAVRGLAGPWWLSFRDEGISGAQGRAKRPGLVC